MKMIVSSTLCRNWLSKKYRPWILSHIHMNKSLWMISTSCKVTRFSICTTLRTVNHLMKVSLRPKTFYLKREPSLRRCLRKDQSWSKIQPDSSISIKLKSSSQSSGFSSFQTLPPRSSSMTSLIGSTFLHFSQTARSSSKLDEDSWSSRQTVNSLKKQNLIIKVLMITWNQKLFQMLRSTPSDKSLLHLQKRTRREAKSRGRETRSWTSLENHTSIVKRTHHLLLVRATKWSSCKCRSITSTSCSWTVSSRRSWSTSYRKKAKTSLLMTLLMPKNLPSSLFYSTIFSSTTLRFSNTCTRLR